MNNKLKTVTLTLNPISVKVSGETKEDLLENAKISIVDQLTNNFPGFSYSINEGNVLSINEVNSGQVVEDDKGNLGIVTGVNQKSINVMLTGHRQIQGPPQLFKESDASFEEVRSMRHDFMIEDGLWGQGDSGYIEVKGEYVEVIVGKNKGKKYPLYIINGKGRHYTVSENQLRLLTDNKPK